MGKSFNITGPCIQNLHYMVDTSEKIQTIITQYIEQGEYITINRARQYGKTTTLECLYQTLCQRYIVFDLSFEGREDYFSSLEAFATGLSMDMYDQLRSGNMASEEELVQIFEKPVSSVLPMRDLSERISRLCAKSPCEILLFIDEVDKAADNEVFLSFLGMLRDKYIERQKGKGVTFKSVVLAGVHDIKNIRMKLRPQEEHQYNSPWNIAASFDVDMSFSVTGIGSMLREYELDYHTGMNIHKVAEQIYYYTNGYPYLVSGLCKIIHDEKLDWSSGGVDEAEKRMVKSINTLFDDIIKNIERYPAFREMLERILLRGAQVAFEFRNPEIDRGMMYGILREQGGKVAISNIIFETVIYNYLISVSKNDEQIERHAGEMSEFVQNGHLNMKLVMQKFQAFMYSEYREEDSSFIEQHARLLFLSFLKPIINGMGHYVVEPQTRGSRRMDIVVFYGSEEQIVELKIWRGEKAEEDGIIQLAGYLKSRGQTQGYLLSFCDNKKAPRDGRTHVCGDVSILETIVSYRDGI